MKIVKKIQLKIVIFTAFKNRCVLHGHVFIMRPDQKPHAGIADLCLHCLPVYPKGIPG